MRLVDVHIHLDFPEYKKDIDNLIKVQEENNVKAIIANGVNSKSNREVLKLQEKFKVVKPALGLYPTDVHNMSFEEIDEEIDFIRKAKPIALGEVGLDNKYLDEGKTAIQKKKQLYAFEKFISLSEKTKLPLIIHSRKAELEIHDLLESSKLKNPVLHCFMGKKKLMQKLSDKGYNFSILPIINKSQQLQEIVNYTNLRQLLTETDGPYMSPVQGKVSEPRYVEFAIKKIAELKKITVEEASNIVFMNYQSTFKNQ